MPEREVQSPISRKGSKAGSGQPMSPGARTNPSRRSDVRRDADEPPQHVIKHTTDPEGAQTTVVGPED